MYMYPTFVKYETKGGNSETPTFGRKHVRVCKATSVIVNGSQYNMYITFIHVHVHKITNTSTRIPFLQCHDNVRNGILLQIERLLDVLLFCWSTFVISLFSSQQNLHHNVLQYNKPDIHVATCTCTCIYMYNCTVMHVHVHCTCINTFCFVR